MSYGEHHLVGYDTRLGCAAEYTREEIALRQYWFPIEQRESAERQKNQKVSNTFRLHPETFEPIYLNNPQ